jgi:hypothetical protein
MTEDITRDGTVQLAQASGEASAGPNVVVVTPPPAGGEIVLPSSPDRVYDLRFDPRLAEVRVIDADGDGDLDMVLVFNAGTAEEARIVFQDMVDAAKSGHAPVLQSGETYFGADAVVAQAQALAAERPTLETTAPAVQQLVGTGVTEYHDDFGQLDPLLVPQGVIPPVAMTFPSLTPEETEEGVSETPGVVVVGSDANDQEGQDATHTVANPNQDDHGPILGGDGSDVLIGDPGGGEFVGQFNVAVAVDVTGSIGPDNIVSLNDAADSFVQQIVDQNIADNTVLRLITFAVRSGQETAGVEFAKTFTWDGSQFVTADGQTLTDAIDQAVANPGGGTDFEPPLQNAADFFNGLNDGSGPAADDVNRIFFLTDGQDNSGPGGDFDPNNVPDIYGPDGLIAQDGLQIRVFGIASAGGSDSGFDTAQLNLLDDGLPPQPGEPLHAGAEPPVDQVEADIAVIGFDNVDAALSNALLAIVANNVGSDVLSGSAANDVIFGDAPDTDSLAAAQGVDLPAGSGWFVFEQLEARDGWDRGDTVAYLRNSANQSALIGDGRGQGDTIDGGTGADVIFGQGGGDALTGGPGADVFVYTLAANEGDDQILDFSTAEGDRLSFLNVSDADASGTLDINDVIDGFVDGGGAGAVDTISLASGTTIAVTDVNGTLTDLASLADHTLINGALA